MNKFAFIPITALALSTLDATPTTFNSLITRPEARPLKTITQEIAEAEAATDDPLDTEPADDEDPVQIDYKNEVVYADHAATGTRVVSSVKQEMKIKLPKKFYENNQDRTLKFYPGYDKDAAITLAYEQGKGKAELPPAEVDVIAEADPVELPKEEVPVEESKEEVSEVRVEESYIQEPCAIEPPSISFAPYFIDLAPTFAAVEETPPPAPSAPIAPPVYPCNTTQKRDPASVVLNFGYTFGHGIDTDKNYTTAGAMYFPGETARNIYPFLGANAYFIEGDDWAFDLGTGARWQPDNSCYLLGANLFYSSLPKDLGTYHQIGFGLEYLSWTWEARVNAYFPVSTRGRAKEIAFYDDYIGDYWVRTIGREDTYSGFDAELGYNIYPAENYRLYGGLGTAYFQSALNNNDSWAFKARALFEWKRFLTLEARTYKESRDNWQWQGVINLTMPFDCFCDPCGCSLRELYTRPVYRNNLIKSTSDCCWETNY